MNFDVKASTILLVKSGSHAYGTNIETSDEDFKGVSIPPKEFVVGPFYNFEQKIELVSNGHPADVTITSLMKTIKLASECNPNVIETLFTDSSDTLFCDEFGDMLVENRDLFLSRQAKYRFTGYAHSQLKRIKGHRSWLMDPPKKKPERSDFGLPDVGGRVLNASTMGAVDELTNDGYSFGGEAMKAITLEKKYATALKHWKRYESWKKNRNPARAAEEARFGFDCYAEDTEFLTREGWKKFDEVSTEDLLATVYTGLEEFGVRKHVNPFSIEFQPFISRFDSQYTGKMVHVTGHHTDILVTANHRMLSSPVSRNLPETSPTWSMTTAETLHESFDLVSRTNPKRSVYENPKEISNQALPPAAYMRLMGWYLSDGTANFRDGKVKSIRISQKKGGRLSRKMANFARAHKEVAKASYYDYDRKPNKFNPTSIVERVLIVNERTVRHQMYEDCGHGSLNVRIPRYVYGLSGRLMKILLQGMHNGDGTEHGDGNVYYTANYDLANDVHELAVMCGMVTSLWGPYEYEGDAPPMYRVFWSDSLSPSKRYVRGANVNISSVKDFRVVCFSVPNGTLVTRRNGKVAYQGNCKHGMHLIRLLRMGTEILSGKGVLVKRPDAEELVSIRRGDRSYDDLLEEAEKLDAECGRLFDISPLPNKPNTKKLNALCVEMHCRYWDKK